MYEVSNNEFREFVRNTHYVTESEKFGWSFVFETAVPKHIKDTITEVWVLLYKLR
jgi:formylglycine-generating enzyme